MKARKRLAPKYIVMAVALVALLAATVTGVTLFLKDDGEVSATQEGILPSETNPNLTQPSETQDDNEQGGEDGESSQINEGNEQTQPGETIDGTTTEETTGSATSGTTSTGTTQGRNPTRDEILDNIEETVVLEDRKVFEGLSLSWTTIKLSTLTTDIGVYKPELTIEKTAVLVNGEEITPNTTVREGDKITYEIKVSNLGNYKATNLVITDSRNVEFDKNAVEAGKTIVELEVLEPGKQATIYVTYEVTKNDVELEDNILNIAYVTDGSKILEDDDNTIAINPNVKKVATKVWKNDAENLRPGSITVQLLADGKKVEGKTLELNATNNWTAEFTDLQKYKDLTRTEIVYSVEEVEVPEGYTSKVEGMTITNTYKEPTVSKTATKVWKNDAENLRTESITVQLLADGEAVEGRTLELNANNNWTAEFTELQKYKDLTRTEIVYSVEEVSVPEGYTSKVEGMTITNTYKEPTTSKIATKVWLGDNANLRPGSITVQLLADGKAVEGKILDLNANNNWTAEFTDLQKYQDLTRTEIVYSVEEVEVPEGYTSTVEGMTITNTYEEPTIEISVIKKWEGINENTSLRPIPGIVAEILADGEKIGENGKKVILSESNGWKCTDVKLQKYKNGTRTPINYTIVELTEIEGYNTTYSQTKENNILTELIIKNTYVEPTVSKTVVKEWVGDSQIVRPQSIKVQLYKDEGNGEVAIEGKTATITADAEGNWKATFNDLPKYVEGTRTLIKYSVKELNVPKDYESVVNGMTITNTYNEPTTSKSVTKVWVGDVPSLRPSSIEVQLYKNEGNGTVAVPGKTATLTADVNGNWTAEFTGLQKYITKTKTEIIYSVKEVRVPEGYTSVANGMTITNTYNEPTTSKTAIKTWAGESDSHIRPTSIAVQLYKNEGNGDVAVSGKTATLTADARGEWTAEFTGLQKYITKTRTEIVYSIKETTIKETTTLPDGYTCTQDTTNPMHIINTYKEPTVNKTVTKIWDDNNNIYEKRPTTVTVKLKANGKDTGKTAQLSKDNNWTAEFNGLLKYDYTNGRKAITYTIEEVPVNGYTATYSINKDTLTVTNTYNKIKQGTITKKWTETSQTKVQVPLDVVFILDTSVSMTQNAQRAEKMIPAVNKAISEILSYNSNNRVSVVAYSEYIGATPKLKINKDYKNENDANVLLSLSNTYKAKTSTTYKEDGKNKTFGNYLVYNSTDKKVSTNVNQLSTQKYRYFEHATYTQAGLELGAKQLINDKNKQLTINGIKVTRIPVIVLVTDGEPTYYTKNYTTPIASNKQDGTISPEQSSTKNPDIIGQGLLSKINKNYGYYTIRTAHYFKNQVNTQYGYSTMKTKMYTIGMGVETQFGIKVLDPGKTVNTSKYVNNNFNDKTVTEELVEQLSSNNYDYADKSYTGEMTTDQLKTAMSQIFTSSIPQTQTWDIIESDIDKARIYLPDVDTTKTITIKQDGINITYNKDEVIAYDSAKAQYYIKLNKLQTCETITVEYVVK